MLDFSWLSDWILSALGWLVDEISALFYGLCNALISGLAGACSAVLDLLPSGSFSSAGSVPSSILPVLNWFLPIPGLVTSLSLYLAAYLLYLGCAPVLRWFKVTK